MKKYIEQIYYGIYYINLYIDKSCGKVVFCFCRILGLLIFNVPKAKKHLANMGETPENFINKHIRQEKNHAYNAPSGLLMHHVSQSILFFYMLILFDIILIIQLVAGYNFLFAFVKKGQAFFWIAYMIMTVITYRCVYHIYWKNDRHKKIIRSYKRKSNKQKQKAIKNFWITLISIIVITFVLLWYEIDVR